MQLLLKVPQQEVWDHWRRVENHKTQYFRKDIRGKLPAEMFWYLCRIEAADIDRLFIISSDNWRDITGWTFRVAEAARRLGQPSDNPGTAKLTPDLLSKEEWLESGGTLDTRLIAVTDDHDMAGPFTFLEGNRRSVVLYRRASLVGCEIYVGVSPEIGDNVWTRYSYNPPNRGSRP